MSIKVYPHYGGDQFSRYQVQLMSMFAGFQVQDGVDRDNDGERDLHRVSVKSGSADRVVLGIQKRKGSFNSNERDLPIIAVDIEQFSIDKTRLRDPRIAQNLSTGNGYETTTRLTAIPMVINFRVSLLASSRTELYDLFEQIVTKFTPGLSVPIYTPISKTQNRVTVSINDISQESSIDIGVSDQVNQLSMSVSMPVYIEHPQSSVNSTIELITLNVSNQISGEQLSQQEIDENS